MLNFANVQADAVYIVPETTPMGCPTTTYMVRAMNT
jgi:hypothetical protein